MKNAAEEVYPKVANYQACLHAKAKAKVKFDGGGHWDGVVVYRDCYIYTIFLITGIHITNMKKTMTKKKSRKRMINLILFFISLMRVSVDFSIN